MKNKVIVKIHYKDLSPEAREFFDRIHEHRANAKGLVSASVGLFGLAGLLHALGGSGEVATSGIGTLSGVGAFLENKSKKREIKNLKDRLAKEGLSALVHKESNKRDELLDRLKSLKLEEVKIRIRGKLGKRRDTRVLELHQKIR